jgi:hypothetical protein
LRSTPVPMRVIAKKRCRAMVEPPEKGERAALNPNLSTRPKPTFFPISPWAAAWPLLARRANGAVTAPSFPGQFADKISSPTRESVAKPGEQRMWLDLLVASGLGLPAMLYGSLLFVNYMQ